MTIANLTKRAVLLFVVIAAAGLAAVVASAQGFGGGGGAAASTRAGMLASALKLDDAQKKDAKAILDDAYKAAAPLRTSLIAAREALGAAVQAGDDAKIDQAIVSYASESTSMASAEAHALAKIMHGLKPDQVDAAGLQTAASLMRGAFVGKKWDTTPDTRFY